jgi:uncharacterized protein
MTFGSAAFDEGIARWDAAAVRNALSLSPGLALAEDGTGSTALHIVARARPSSLKRAPEDAIPIARALIDAGTDIDHVALPQEQSDLFCPTPLWQAIAWSRNHALADYLLEAGASPEGCLWSVVWSDDAAMCAKLLARQPDLELRLNGDTPLLFAARNKREAMVRALAAAGANLGAADQFGAGLISHLTSRKCSPGLIDDMRRALAAQNAGGRIARDERSEALKARAARWQAAQENLKARRAQLRLRDHPAVKAKAEKIAAAVAARAALIDAKAQKVREANERKAKAQAAQQARFDARKSR